MDGEESYRPELIIDAERHIFFFNNTSGSTGAPKLVPHSHVDMILSILLTAKETRGLKFVFSTMQWIIGVNTTLSSIINGLPVILTARSFDPEWQAQIIEKYQVQLIRTYPGHFRRLMECVKQKPYNVGSLTGFFTAGSKFSEEEQQDFRTMAPKCKIITFYSMTEANNIASNSVNYKPDSVGQLYPGVQVKVCYNLNEKKPSNLIPFRSSTSLDLIWDQMRVERFVGSFHFQP